MSDREQQSNTPSPSRSAKLLGEGWLTIVLYPLIVGLGAAILFGIGLFLGA